MSIKNAKNKTKNQNLTENFSISNRQSNESNEKALRIAAPNQTKKTASIRNLQNLKFDETRNLRNVKKSKLNEFRYEK